MSDCRPMSVKEAAHLLGIARSTLYGHLSDFEHLSSDGTDTFIRVGRLKKIYPEHFEEIKRRLACKETTLKNFGTGKLGVCKVMSSAK